MSVLFCLKQFTHMSTKLKHKRPGKEIESCTNKSTTTSSPRNVKTMYQFSLKNLMRYSFRL